MGIIPPWSDLPTELLSIISNCLNSNPLDILNFRCVCKSWSSSSSSSSPISRPKLFPPLPLTISPPPYPLRGRYYYSTVKHTHNILSVTTVYFLRPPSGYDFSQSESTPKGWILFADQSNLGKVSIRRPFTNLSFPLPINFPRTLDLHSFRPTELCRFYNITRHGELAKLSVWSGLVRKVVLLDTVCGLVVVALSDEGKLGLLRLGFQNKDNCNEVSNSDAKWDVIHDGKGFRFDDIVDFKGRMLGIDRSGQVYKIEIGGSSSSSPIGINAFVPKIAGGGRRRKRLVQSLGCLYMVVRNNIREETDPKFKVYELNEGIKKWVKVNSLGGRTFFLGLEFSFSASAEELHGSCGRNCVMFKEKSFFNYKRYDDDSNLFKDLKCGALNIGVWNMEDAAKLGVIGSLPGYSNVLWPPPYWIWKIEMSERVGTLLTALERLELRIPDYEKLEAKLNELSLREQNAALTVIKSGIKMKDTLDQARGIDKMLKQIKEAALSWQQRCNPPDLHNHGGTLTLETEEQRETAKMLQNVIEHGNCIVKLLSMEMKLHKFLLPLEENTSELEDVVKTRKFSASMGELPEHILFT